MTGGAGTRRRAATGVALYNGGTLAAMRSDARAAPATSARAGDLARRALHEAGHTNDTMSVANVRYAPPRTARMTDITHIAIE